MAADVGRHTRCLLVAALVSIVASGCQLITPELGPTSVTVTAETSPGAPISFGGTTVDARLEAFGIAVAEWEIDGEARAVPPGDYTLEVWTVHHSDAIGCEIDPAAPGGQRCERDSTIVARCSVQLVLRGGFEVAYRYRRDANDACTLEPA